MEFEDKEKAKMVARILDGTKCPKKYLRNRMARTQYVWNLKYLKGFKWHHLMEYKQSVRQLQRTKFERAVGEAHRQASYYKSQVHRAKVMQHVMNGGKGGTPAKRNRTEMTHTDVVQISDDRVSVNKGRKKVKTVHRMGQIEKENVRRWMDRDSDKRSAHAITYDDSDDEVPMHNETEHLPTQKEMHHRRAGSKRRLKTLSKSLWKRPN